MISQANTTPLLLCLRYKKGFNGKSVREAFCIRIVLHEKFFGRDVVLLIFEEDLVIGVFLFSYQKVVDNGFGDDCLDAPETLGGLYKKTMLVIPGPVPPGTYFFRAGTR